MTFRISGSTEQKVSFFLDFRVFHRGHKINQKHVLVYKICIVTKVLCKHLVEWIYSTTTTTLGGRKKFSLKYGQRHNEELLDTSSFLVGVSYFFTYVL